MKKHKNQWPDSNWNYIPLCWCKMQNCTLSYVLYNNKNDSLCIKIENKDWMKNSYYKAELFMLLVHSQSVA